MAKERIIIRLLFIFAVQWYEASFLNKPDNTRGFDWCMVIPVSVKTLKSLYIFNAY